MTHIYAHRADVVGISIFVGVTILHVHRKMHCMPKGL